MQSFRYHIFLLLFSILAITACKKEPIRQEDLYAEQVNVKFQLALSISGIGPNPLTRAPEDELEGDDPFENKITSLTIFVIDYKDATDPLDWTKVSHANIISSIPAPSTLDVEIRTTTGKKQIYVGANMTGQHISSFYSGKGVFTSNGNTYSEVISDFVHPIRGITMFGQMFTESTPNVFDNPVFEITASNTEANPIDTELELSRVVSKVALTYTNSIPALDPLNPDAPLALGIDGSIKIKNIYFMLNNTSKTIDFIGGTNIYDYSYCRYLMDDYLAYNSNNSFNPLLYSYKKNPENDFMIYAPGSFVPSNVAGNAFGVKPILLPFETPGDPYRDISGLEKYVGVINGKHTHYDSFLYCLENTVSTFNVTNNVLDMRHGINTKVVVAAKYTPSTVEHTDDPVNTAPTTHSIALATAEDDFDDMTINDPNGEGTFYAVLVSANTYMFYTFNAKTYIENNPPTGGIPEFITYKGGYGYYATFISQPVAANIDEDEYYDLKRNHYYILSVKEFSPPGVVYPQDAYMLANSEITNWVSGKPTTVTVE